MVQNEQNVQPFEQLSQKKSHSATRTGLCPCCNENKSIQYTIGMSAITVAICAHRPIDVQLRTSSVGVGLSHQCFAACQPCKRISAAAVEWALQNYGEETESFPVNNRTKPAVLTSPITCQFETMAEMFSHITKGQVRLHIQNLVSSKDDVVPLFEVGNTVTVSSVTRKIGPNPCHGGGIVRARTFTHDYQWVYDVEFTVDGRTEKAIPSSRLSPLDVDTKLGLCNWRWTNQRTSSASTCSGHNDKLVDEFRNTFDKQTEDEVARALQEEMKIRVKLVKDHLER